MSQSHPRRLTLFPDAMFPCEGMKYNVAMIHSGQARDKGHQTILEQPMRINLDYALTNQRPGQRATLVSEMMYGDSVMGAGGPGPINVRHR